MSPVYELMDRLMEMEDSDAHTPEQKLEFYEGVAKDLETRWYALQKEGIAQPEMESQLIQDRFLKLEGYIRLVAGNMLIVLGIYFLIIA